MGGGPLRTLASNGFACAPLTSHNGKASHTETAAALNRWRNRWAHGTHHCVARRDTADTLVCLDGSGPADCDL